MTAAAATGEVKLYQSVIGGIMLATVPIAYIVLKLGGNPTTVYIVHLLICILAFFARLYIVRFMIELPITRYLKEVLARCIIVCIFALIIPLYLKSVLDENFLSVFGVCAISFFLVIVCSYVFGLTAQERSYVQKKNCRLSSREKRINDTYCKERRLLWMFCLCSAVS